MRTLRAMDSLWLASSLWRWVRHGVVLLVLVLVCTACDTSSTSPFSLVSPLAPGETVSGQAPHSLAGSAWEEMALPVPATDVQGIGVSPTDPATIFACTAHLLPTNEAGGVAAQPMTLWRTTDTGVHWTWYDPVLGTGIACQFAFAPDDPQRVGLLVEQTVQDGQPCAHDGFYLTADGGATWQRLPPRASSVHASASVWCDLRVTRRHLYLTYSFTLAPQAAQVSVLERSDDNGGSWTRADRGLGDDALFSPPQIGPGGTLAVTVTRAPAFTPGPVVTPGPGQAPYKLVPTMLWMSSDGGNTWRQVSALPDGAGTFLLSLLPPTGSSGSMWPTPDHPFYALEHEQIPSNLYRERVLMSGDGHSWTVLPPLPVPGVSAERPGILQALGVLPDGRLVVWGSDPQRGMAMREQFFPAFWLWVWKPVDQRWQVVASPLETDASEGCGLCWQAQTVVGRDGAATVYVARSYMRGTTQPGLFRVRLPDGV